MKETTEQKYERLLYNSIILGIPLTEAENNFITSIQ
jgi:hypothetical protein